MAGNLQPLDQQFAIVDAQGRPTLYFTQWAQQRQISITDSITLSDLTDYLAAHPFVPLASKIPEIYYIDRGFGADGPAGHFTFNVFTAATFALEFDLVDYSAGALIANVSANHRWLLSQYGTTTGWEFDADPYVNTHKIYHEGNLAFGSGLTYAAGVLSASGGGASYEASPTKPVAASFTLVNGGVGTTLTDTALGVAMICPTGVTDTLHLAQWNTAVASTTFTITVRLRPTLLFPVGNHYQSCLIIRNSSNDRQIVFGDFSGNSQTLVQNWTNNATFSGNVAGPVSAMTAAFPWRRVVCTAGAMSFDASPDGVTWTSIGTSTLAAFLTAAGGTADRVGIGVRGVGGDVCYSLVLV